MGLSLNPLADVAKLGNAIGGLFGNNTYGGNTNGIIGEVPSAALNVPRDNVYGRTGGGSAGLTSSQLKQLQSAGLVNASGQPTGASISSGTASGSGSSLDPQTLAAYQQAIANTQAALDRLPSQQTAQQGSIDSSYQAALNQLLLGKNQAQQSYDTTKQQTAKDYVGAKNTIGSQAGSTLNSLLRLLGARGAGGSSAYTQAAPQAVARQATLQRADVGNQFGQNSQALDQNWGNYLQGYNSSVDNAGFQKNQQYGALQNQIDTNKASLLQTLAQLQSVVSGSTAAAQPYLDQANSLLNKTASYAPATFSVNPTPYTAPSLASYTVNPQAAPTYQGQTATNDYYSPYLQSLLGKKQTATA